MTTELVSESIKKQEFISHHRNTGSHHPENIKSIQEHLKSLAILKISSDITIEEKFNDNKNLIIYLIICLVNNDSLLLKQVAYLKNILKNISSYIVIKYKGFSKKLSLKCLKAGYTFTESELKDDDIIVTTAKDKELIKAHSIKNYYANTMNRWSLKSPNLTSKRWKEINKILIFNNCKIFANVGKVFDLFIQNENMAEPYNFSIAYEITSIHIEKDNEKIAELSTNTEYIGEFDLLKDYIKDIFKMFKPRIQTLRNEQYETREYLISLYKTCASIFNIAVGFHMDDIFEYNSNQYYRDLKINCNIPYKTIYTVLNNYKFKKKSVTKCCHKLNTRKNANIYCEAIPI